ncbi:hypothetical protein ABZT51_46335 [Streptomyces sp. NPDC005373]|uniref:hypothetical protein n=1 Tax=Streptomyces sp. NPDC005373 TaxID=3156879 RepID=UPI0033BCDC64
MTTPDTLPDTSTAFETAAADLAPHRVAGPRRWWDWVLAADPGLGQLQAGWRSLVAMVTSLAVGYGMAQALSIPVMIAMMVAGMMGLMSAFAVAENGWDRLARAILWMPFPYTAVLWLCATLNGERVPQMVLMIAALALTFFFARFGPMALLTGMMLFNGLMVGMLAGIPAALVGKAFAVALVSAAAVLVTRLLLCYPMPREDFLRTQRAFVVEARRVADAAVDALDPDADRKRAVRRTNRALRRLNITTVTIDGRLAQPEVAADPAAAELLHRHLFDAELALRGIGQAAADLTRLPVPEPLREALAVGLVLARDTPLGQAEGLRPAAAHIQERAETILRDAAAGRLRRGRRPRPPRRAPPRLARRVPGQLAHPRPHHGDRPGRRPVPADRRPGEQPAARLGGPRAARPRRGLRVRLAPRDPVRPRPRARRRGRRHRLPDRRRHRPGPLLLGPGRRHDHAVRHQHHA